MVPEMALASLHADPGTALEMARDSIVAAAEEKLIHRGSLRVAESALCVVLEKVLDRTAAAANACGMDLERQLDTLVVAMAHDMDSAMALCTSAEVKERGTLVVERAHGTLVEARERGTWAVEKKRGT